MSGLTLTLRPREKFLVGGNLIENGPRRSSIRISDDDVFVLRLSDALHPDEVKTPVTRAYHAVQLILACEISKEEGLSQLTSQMTNIAPIFAKAGHGDLIDRVVNGIALQHFYAVLVALKSLTGIEAEMLGLPRKDSVEDHPEQLRAISGCR